MKSFEIPEFYRSPLITSIKQKRKQQDKLKKDFEPTHLDFGVIEIFLARHFGFCYGVENAIEIAFKTVYENPGKRIFLLSEMIHNPQVNRDLKESGVQFIMNTVGQMYVDWSELKKDDIVIIPAFGTTIETENKLKSIGISPLEYNTTCPFVQKVWNRSEQIGRKGYTVIIHGKPLHEETRATFSHSSSNAPSVIVKDIHEAMALSKYIKGEVPLEAFYTEFKGQYSSDFDATKHFERIGVVNQTTMLATETQEIADFLKNVMTSFYSLTEKNIAERFADTRDTLCYATTDNQSAVKGLLDVDADIALVVGGYNSSNTSHLVELCEEKLTTYYIENETKILDKNSISHYDMHEKKVKVTEGYFPEKEKPKILITSGASCPDAVVEKVIEKLLSFYDKENDIQKIADSFL